MGNITESSIEYLYNQYKPAYNNLYEVTLTYGLGAGNSDFKNKWSFNNDSNQSFSNYIRFHATDVDFGGESIAMVRNAVTKNFTLSSQNAYSRNDTLKITWREDADWKVKKFHEDWVSLLYNREEDHFNSVDNAEDLYMTVKVRIPIESSTENNTIVFEGVFPNNVPGIKLTWATAPTVVTHGMIYYVTRWYWENNNES